MKLTIVVVAGFLSFIFGDKNQNQTGVYPPENFSVIQAHLENGKPVIGSINMAYKNYVNKARYPWCITINIALDLKNVTKDGLPIKSESDIANKFEDKLLKDMGKITTVHYIGHLYNDSFLDIYAYTDNPEKINEYLKIEVNKEGPTFRPFRYELKQDPNWNEVRPFLK
jgi:hypothetical protein